MQPKQQAKDAWYKPIGTEKPYTKKRLKAGAQITFTVFLALNWMDLLTSWRGVVDYASEKASERWQIKAERQWGTKPTDSDWRTLWGILEHA